jgi:hypothetical protein
MTKELLEFFGGLFVFLAAMVPVIRGIWRSLRRRRTIANLFYTCLQILNATLLVAGYIVFSLGWNEEYLMTLLLIFICSFAAAFWIDDSPITRGGIAVFVFCMGGAILLLSDLLRKLGTSN